MLKAGKETQLYSSNPQSPLFSQPLPQEVTSIHIKMKSSQSNREGGEGGWKGYNEEEQVLGSNCQNQLDNYQDNVSIPIPLVEKSVLQSVIKPIASQPQLTRTTTWRFDHTLFCALFTMAWIAGIILLAITSRIWLLLVGLGFYYFECLVTDFTRIYKFSLRLEDFQKLLSETLADTPDISFKATSFTLIAKQKCPPPSTSQLKSVADPRPVLSSSCSLVRIESFSEQRSFDFKKCLDSSACDDKRIINLIESEGICFVKAQLKWKGGDTSTIQSYSLLKEEIVGNARKMSPDIEVAEFAQLPRLSLNKNLLLVYANKSSHLNTFAFNKYGFSVISLLGFSLPYRLYYLNAHKTLLVDISKTVFH